ncbi:RlpA-like protein precursor [Legionella massiliensis]|uniref:Endolytic peptidoglycan transglycosylase RlpA n=1 Tax=Legionella massiliensis TaxID=1034943 RepID=A0A078L2V0_9GAMM|nr:septal ring lytic transglycosylase RlpA family protein [Legionella massiliensis]CDZ78348.1 RlpA-like protein precursor [Legionella massiliensis]CEE14086.1 RlpA-like protein precursor [Legionella massiliensis]
MRFIFILIASYFLSSCAIEPTQSRLTTSKTYNKSYKKSKAATQVKDGAPKGPVPRFFKEPQPKSEPYSRYGNPGSYAVAGQTYKVMKSSGGYKARGIASWYGTKFHAKRTSSGDKYDMYAMTAAHRTLPLPTYVRVKNLNNGRVVVVKVNDRGPFHSNRLIDLSYAAATKLGVFPSGTAMVEIEAVSSAKHVAQYYVQAGAFSSAKLAAVLKAKLTKLTPSPVKVERYSKRYIVKVGPFPSKTMSDNLRIKLASNGVKGSFSILQ